MPYTLTIKETTPVSVRSKRGFSNRVSDAPAFLQKVGNVILASVLG